MRRTIVIPAGAAVLAAAAAVWAATHPAPGAGVAAPVVEGGAAAARGTVVTVYKSPTCGCCRKWVDHLREHGFEVVTHDTDDVAQVKATTGVPGELASCHTAIVDGYAIEGHVPADAIRRLLEERPAVAGLAVPGMPMGSPGMEGPRKDRYDVIAFGRDGKTRVYESR